MHGLRHAYTCLLLLAVATKCSSVARSLKLRNVDPVSTWMGYHQRKLGAVNLGPFVGVDLNL